MKNLNLKIKANNMKGITLVALIISIIVLLILATVSISLVINNGILDKAKSAVDKYSDGEIEEQIKLAYSEYQMAKHVGETKTASEFLQEKLRIIFDDNELIVTESVGIFKVIFSKGSVYKYEANLQYILKSKTRKDSYVGNYADIDEDGTVDGIIFVDLLTGSIRDKKQYGNLDGVYSLPEDVNENNVRTYYISQKNFDGPFGKNDVISPKGTNGKERFYVMTLNDFTIPAHTDDEDKTKNYPAYNGFCWYLNAKGKMDETDTSVDFKTGKTNTDRMIKIWNANGGNGGYEGATKNDRDVWKHIQEKYKEGWFIPSRGEWAAILNELGITSNNYSEYGLASIYCTSSQKTDSAVWEATLFLNRIGHTTVDNVRAVRFAKTF